MIMLPISKTCWMPRIHRRKPCHNSGGIPAYAAEVCSSYHFSDRVSTRHPLHISPDPTCGDNGNPFSPSTNCYANRPRDNNTDKGSRYSHPHRFAQPDGDSLPHPYAHPNPSPNAYTLTDKPTVPS